MAYTDFTLESAESTLGVTTHPGDLFPNLSPISVPSWLENWLGCAMRLALVSEKARSEFIVAPILLAVRESVGDTISILSGQRLDVDPDPPINGRVRLYFGPGLSRSHGCDTPLLTMVEAKKNDIDGGLGQCAAQMVAAQLYNERAAESLAMYGCVTTGEDWQFLRLSGARVILHRPRLYIADVGLLLAAFKRSVEGVADDRRRPSVTTKSRISSFRLRSRPSNFRLRNCVQNSFFGDRSGLFRPIVVFLSWRILISIANK